MANQTGDKDGTSLIIMRQLSRVNRAGSYLSMGIVEIQSVVRRLEASHDMGTGDRTAALLRVKEIRKGRYQVFMSYKRERRICDVKKTW